MGMIESVLKASVFFCAFGFAILSLVFTAISQVAGSNGGKWKRRVSTRPSWGCFLFPLEVIARSLGFPSVFAVQHHIL